MRELFMLIAVIVLAIYDGNWQTCIHKVSIDQWRPKAPPAT